MMRRLLLGIVLVAGWLGNPACRKAETVARPLSFLGFSVPTSLGALESMIKTEGGRFSCDSTDNSRYRCSGYLRFPGFEKPVEMRVLAIQDSVAELVFLPHVVGSIAPFYVSYLTESYGPPRHEEEPGSHQQWEWQRGNQWLRIVERLASPGHLETTITLGDARSPTARGDHSPELPPQQP
jgi:hypothetical protein